MAAIAALACAVPALASPARVDSLRRISGTTPFPTGCGVPGEDTPSSEAEPHLAVDPKQPSRLVATWQQDRFPIDGGALSNLAAWSSNGGRTWHGTRLPAGHRRRTGRRGRTSIVVRLRHRGVRRVRVSKAGFRSGRARVRVLRP